MSASRAPFRLRSTCDACSNAKVKCDKKQPTCDRCQVYGFTCSYSPSRRHGKHSWKKFSESIASPPAVTLPSEPAMEVESSNIPTGNPNENTSCGGDDTILVDFDHDLVNGFEVGSHWTGLDLGIPLSNGVGTPDGFQLHDSTSTGPSSLWDGPSSTATTAASSIPESLQVPTAPAVDCEAEAFNALHSLHSCTMLHTDHPGEIKHSATRTITSYGGVTDYMPPLDKVLHFNRSAVSTLKGLLNSPGVHQPHLALLYMTIVSKVLFWYRLVVSSQYQSQSSLRFPSSESNNSSSHSSPPGTSSSISDRAVKPVAFQIGVFDLGDEDQKLLMKGVLLREVRKLESVVDKMKGLGDEHSRDDEYHEEQHVLNWYALAGCKMQAEVQDTLRQIKEFGAGTAGRDR